MTTATRKRMDLPEQSIREIAHRLRFWLAINDIPTQDKVEMVITLPNRDAALRARHALMRELKPEMLDPGAYPIQTPRGDFALFLEGVTLIIASKEGYRPTPPGADAPRGH